MLIRGLVGRNLLGALFPALSAAVLLQIFFSEASVAGAADGFGPSLLVTTLYIAAAGGIIGAGLAAAEPASQRNKARAASRALTGFMFGTVGGLAGGLAAHVAAGVSQHYATGMQHQQNMVLTHLVGSFAGWGLAGLAIGIGRNFGQGPERTKNGLISGVIGGLLGGLVVGLASTSFASAAAARLIGLLGFGLAVGGAAAGTDETRRDNWLLVLNGPMQGAEYTLYCGRILIGSSPLCEVFLPFPTVAPIHCEMEFDYGEALLTNLSSERSVLVNGRPCRSCTIIPGYVIQVGDNLLRLCEKED